MSTLFLTGVSGGLGHVIREHYLNKGWFVCGFDSKDDGFMSESYRFFQFDSLMEKSVETAFAEAGNECNVPRQLISTIGGIKPNMEIINVPVDDFKVVIELNLLSTFLCVKHALILMKPKGSGSIITISADASLHPEKNRATYIAAKTAVRALTECVAEETKEYGITANCILPKVIHTKANESWGTPEEIPRWTDPSDIAAFCEYLASDAGNAINGASIRMPNRA